MRLLPRLASIAIAASLLSLPAFAGPAETALLRSYEGEWRGTGKVTGPDPGSVVCRLSMKAANDGKLGFTGRCSFGAGATSFRGTIAYNDAARRFESASTATGISATTIGRKQGGGIVFSSNGMETRMGTASSVMALSGGRIALEFKLIDKKGRTTASKIAFKKS